MEGRGEEEREKRLKQMPEKLVNRNFKIKLIGKELKRKKMWPFFFFMNRKIMIIINSTVELNGSNLKCGLRKT